MKDFTLTATSASLTNNTTVSKTNFNVGETITVKGAATGGTSPYTYEFYYKRSTASSWTKFGSNGSGTFKPGSAGTFTIRTYANHDKNLCKGQRRQICDEGLYSYSNFCNSNK